LISIKQVNQYQKGIKFMLGKYIGLMEPGWRLVFPIIQTYRKVDLRVKAVDVPNQEAITKDNISVAVNAVIYYKVKEADKVVLEVENFTYAISQMAQTTMRNASDRWIWTNYFRNGTAFRKISGKLLTRRPTRGESKLTMWN